MKTVYFILGVHRSGTSAFGGVLNILGLQFGQELMQATKNNPKGYFENMAVYKLNEKILQTNNSSWDDCHFYISQLSKEKQQTYKQAAKEIIVKEYGSTADIVIKDPRNCILFPIWESACKDLGLQIKVIVPYRTPSEVAASLHTRNGFSFEKSIVLWAHNFLSAELLSRKHKRIFISFDGLLNNTRKTCQKLSRFIQVETDEEKEKLIADFLDKNIKNNNSSLENFTKKTPKFLRQLISVMRKDKFEETKSINSIRKEFYFCLEMFQYNEIVEKSSKYKQIQVELNQNKKKVSLLERLKDISTVDESYYTLKYPDIAKYKGTPREHYYNFGKKEERSPNQYCEDNKLDAKKLTSKGETIYWQEAQLNKSSKEIAQQVNVIKETEMRLGELQIKHNATQEEVKKLQHKLSLNQEQTFKTEQTLKKAKNHIQALDVLNNINKIKQQKFKEEVCELNNKTTQLIRQLKRNETKIVELTLQKEKIEQQLHQQTQEVALLNSDINDIVVDLVTIKESKCWVYTKPIRALGNFKKKKDV